MEENEVVVYKGDGHKGESIEGKEKGKWAEKNKKVVVNKRDDRDGMKKDDVFGTLVAFEIFLLFLLFSSSYEPFFSLTWFLLFQNWWLLLLELLIEIVLVFVLL